VPSICVVCGSRAGRRDEYVAVARKVGQELGRRGVTLVYGGGQVGLMGALADAVLQAGTEVIGIIPTSLTEQELAHPGVTRLYRVDGMHDRKALMLALSDAFLALPGGFGTMDEFFEIVTWAQLRLHAKPIGLLNAAGYYDPLVRWIEQACAEDFVPAKHRQLVRISDRVDHLLDLLLAAASR